MRKEDDRTDRPIGPSLKPLSTQDGWSGRRLILAISFLSLITSPTSSRR